LVKKSEQLAHTWNINRQQFDDFGWWLEWLDLFKLQSN
jgi:hypothetical protein